MKQEIKICIFAISSLIIGFLSITTIFVIKHNLSDKNDEDDYEVQ